MPDAELANQAWESLLTAESRLMRGFQAESMWSGLSMAEYDVLYTLAKQPGPVRMSALGCSVLLSQPGLSRLVDRLVGRGLVERGPDPTDGRSVLVGLTAAGRSLQKEIGRRHAASVARAMSALDATELARLKELADKLVAESERAGDLADQDVVRPSRADLHSRSRFRPENGTSRPSTVQIRSGRRQPNQLKENQ